MKKLAITSAFLALALTTGCKPTTSRVTAIDPENGAVVESAPDQVQIWFDRAMDAVTINDDSVRATGTMAGDLSIVVHYDELTNSVIVDLPKTGLTPGETIELQLTDAIRSQSNKRLRAFRSSFRIAEPEPIVLDPFELVAMSPAVESPAISRLTTFTAQFSDGYNPFAISTSQVIVSGDRSGTRVVDFPDLYFGGDELRIAIDRAFLPGERVTLTLTSDLVAVTGVELTPRVIGFVSESAAPSGDPTQWMSSAFDNAGIVRMADVDGDGEDEWLAIASNGAVDVWQTTPTGTEVLASWTFATPIIDAVVGDFDADGLIDLVALSTDRFYFQRGLATSDLFSSSTTIQLGDVDATGLAALTYDADGIADLCVLTSGTAPAQLFRGGTPTFASFIELPAFAATTDIVAADFDGDGQIDLAGLEGDRTLVISWQASTTGAATERFALDHTTRALRTGNFDGDDDADLLAIGPDAAISETWLSAPDRSFTVVTSTLHVDPTAVHVVDWNADGRLDILSTITAQGVATINHGLGDGRFDAIAAEVKLGARFETIAFGDVDGDRVLDLVGRTDDGSLDVLVSTPLEAPIDDLIYIEDFSAAAGATGVPFTVFANNEDAIDGFTAVIGFDPAVLDLTTLSTLGTDAEAVGVELELPTIDALAGSAVVAVLFDFLPPYDGSRLAAGTGHSILAGQLSVSSSAATGTASLTLENGLGSPSTDNVFVIGGQSLTPDLESPALTIIAGTSGGGTSTPIFIRGDVNGDGAVDLSDGTMLQQFLFQGGATPGCLDAADFNDDGRIDSADPIAIFDFLMGTGSPPPAPYPGSGADPTTSDELDCQTSL